MGDNRALDLAVDIGKCMIRYGAEINRVEETIIRICTAFGFEKVEVFSLISLITVTGRTSDGGQSYTTSRRVYVYSADFNRLDELNSLSRDLCSGKIGVEDARERYREIKTERKKFHPTVLIGYILAAASFAIFFGGGWRDSVCSAVIAVPIYFMNTFVTQRRINRLFFTVINSFIAGSLANLAAYFSLTESADYIMIGDIMLLIPGLMLINSFRELFCGDIVSGATRLLDSLITAIAIACGFAMPIFIFKHIGV